MFDTLLEMPLFRGVSRERISEIAGKAKFHFIKYKPDDEIIAAGDSCTHLSVIVTGAVRITFRNPRNGISVSQTLYGPDIVTPEFLFGRTTLYPCRVTAISNVSILEIEKADYLKILTIDPVFMLNYLNYLAMNAQKAVDGTLALMSGELRKRIAYWIISLSQQSGKSIVLASGKLGLAASFGVTRNALAETLKTMTDDGLVVYEREADEIHVVDRRGLLALIFPPAP